jgi:uncharacterized protein (TIGR02118 family)
MPATLLALYRNPEGGDEALQTFRRRYHEEHLPLIAKVPGLRSTKVQRIAHAYYNEADLVMVTEMTFDDRASLDAAMASDEMRTAGRNLREIAPGMMTLVVLEADYPPEGLSVPVADEHQA